MSEYESISIKEAASLLNQLELILDSDPLFDELGFIHQSQFNTLNNEAATRESNNGMSFWHRDHKLGISMHVVVPLYKAAKVAFFDAIALLKQSENQCVENDDFVKFSCIENEVMKHSKALLLLSCDFGTAWNSRKLILSKKLHIPMFIEELVLSALVLSCSPKSEQAWGHRRWVIKMIAGKCSSMQEIFHKEFELVEKITEQSKMNYRAWNHHCWLVSYLTGEQVLLQLRKSRNWCALHVADNSCFHYRMRLLTRILEKSCQKLEDASYYRDIEISQIWQDELQWNEELIKQYIGRESLWLYRRFLSLYWMRHFATDLSNSNNLSEFNSCKVIDINLFWDYELCLVNSCSTILDGDYEDFQAQAVHSATYFLWLTEHIPKSRGIELKKKLNAGNWKTMLNMACPERSSLWNNLSPLDASN